MKSKKPKTRQRKGEEIKIPRNSATSRNKDFLHSLYRVCSCKKKNKLLLTEEVLRNASPEELDSIYEIIQNLLVGSIPGGVDEKLKNKLQPFKNVLRKIGSDQVIKPRKKQILLQSVKRKMRGGILPLAPILLPILSSLAGSAISSLIP